MTIKHLILCFISIITGMAFASNYIAFIENKNDFFKKKNEGSSWNEYSVFTEWTNHEKTNCDYSPLATNYYAGLTFNQTETCDLVQTRTQKVYRKNEDTNQVILKEEIQEFQTLKNLSNSITGIGTTYAKTCFDARKYNAKEDGLYEVKFGDRTEIVYCDMKHGGWTLLAKTGSDLDLRNLSHIVINKNKPPETLDPSLYDYLPRISDFYEAMDKTTVFKFTCRENATGSMNSYYHSGITDFDNYFNISSGAYTGEVQCATDPTFTDNFASGSNCFSGEVNDEKDKGKHRYFKAAPSGYGWAIYGGDSTPKSLRHCGKNANKDGVQSQGYIWFK